MSSCGIREATPLGLERPSVAGVHGSKILSGLEQIPSIKRTCPTDICSMNLTSSKSVSAGITLLNGVQSHEVIVLQICTGLRPVKDQE